MTRIQSVFLLVLLALSASFVQAQQASGLTVGISDARTLKVQRKVDQLFERGEYDRAYFIYRNQLAPLGDKYAQYMVGFMHLTGKGVAEDPVTASAWYRLAAERQTPQFVAVRDMLLEDMSPEQRQQSDQMFVEIRRNYSDLIILLNSIKRNVRDTRPTTGSRLRTSSPMTVIDAKSPNQAQSSAIFYGRIESELEANLVMLAEIGEFSDLETDPTRVDIDEVERRVNERLGLVAD
ncbi:MAG: hypothetical protein WBN07_02820 [Woeseiaceae bacterium]